MTDVQFYGLFVAPFVGLGLMLGLVSLSLWLDRMDERRIKPGE